MIQPKKYFNLIILLILIIVIGFGCEKELENKPKAKKTITYQGTIAAMGNSLTEGLGVEENQAYPALLEKKLSRNKYNFKVINAGISGETSTGALSRINWVLTLKPDIVILETGANDGLRGIDPLLTQKNIHEIIKILKENKVIVILAGMQMVKNMGKEYTMAFQKIYPELAKQHKIIFMPFFLKDVAGRPSLNQADSIHPNAKGYKLIAENIYPYVIQAVEKAKN